MQGKVVPSRGRLFWGNLGVTCVWNYDPYSSLVQIVTSYNVCKLYACRWVAEYWRQVKPSKYANDEPRQLGIRIRQSNCAKIQRESRGAQAKRIRECIELQESENAVANFTINIGVIQFDFYLQKQDTTYILAPPPVLSVINSKRSLRWNMSLQSFCGRLDDALLYAYKTLQAGKRIREWIEPERDPVPNFEIDIGVKIKSNLFEYTSIFICNSRILHILAPPPVLGVSIIANVLSDEICCCKDGCTTLCIQNTSGRETNQRVNGTTGERNPSRQFGNRHWSQN